jgi:hypothetical protein
VGGPGVGEPLLDVGDQGVGLRPAAEDAPDGAGLFVPRDAVVRVGRRLGDGGGDGGQEGVVVGRQPGVEGKDDVGLEPGDGLEVDLGGVADDGGGGIAQLVDGSRHHGVGLALEPVGDPDGRHAEGQDGVLVGEPDGDDLVGGGLDRGGAVAVLDLDREGVLAGLGAARVGGRAGVVVVTGTAGAGAGEEAGGEQGSGGPASR